MNSADRNALKEAIRRELGLLEGSLESLEEAARPVSPDNAIGRLSRQDALQSQQLHRNSLAKTKKRISQLRHALERVEGDPGYGICRECEEPIPMKRLLLLPESQTCVRCVSE